MALTAYQRHVQKQMKAGKSMKQAAASWKKSSRPQSSRKTKSKSKSTGGTKHVSRRRSGFNTQKIFGAIRTISLLAPAGGEILQNGLNAETGMRIMQKYTGYRPGAPFRFDKLVEGWGPYVATSVVTKLVPRITSFVRNIF